MNSPVFLDQKNRSDSSSLTGWFADDGGPVGRLSVLAHVLAHVSAAVSAALPLLEQLQSRLLEVSLPLLRRRRRGGRRGRGLLLLHRKRGRKR